MIRRVAWFVGGMATGAATVGYARRKVNAAVDRMRPANLANAAAASIRRGGRRLADAMHEGMTAARRREDELRAERDGRLVRLRDHLADGDEVIVDGEVVEPGRVILLRRPDHPTRR